MGSDQWFVDFLGRYIARQFARAVVAAALIALGYCWGMR